jgi:hypothetical protein
VFIFVKFPSLPSAPGYLSIRGKRRKEKKKRERKIDAPCQVRCPLPLLFLLLSPPSSYGHKLVGHY